MPMLPRPSALAFSALALLSALAPAAAQDAPRTPAPPGAYLYIGWPNEGEVLGRKPFRVWFGLRNMGVAPAGIAAPNTGHHHLLIDVDGLPLPDEPIPNDKNHLHFGIGQTETLLELPPGKHTLQLIMGDQGHVPHDPPVVSKKITVTVR
jgi:hypothetical protein